jgi:hypothetical protein
MDRLRRAFNAVRDAQEMLERLMRTGPATLHKTLPASIEDLEWTADALSTALRALQEAADAPTNPVAAPALTAPRPS